MLEALGTRLKSFYDSGVEKLSPPLASLHSTADTSTATASLGIDFSQKEVVSLSNVWKEGNWAVGCFRVAFVLQSAATLLISAKKMMCDAKKNGEDSVSRLNSANFKTLFGHTVALTSNVLSLATWANRSKLISLGEASFRTSLVSYVLENAVNFSLGFGAMSKTNHSQKFGTANLLVKARSRAEAVKAFHFISRMADGTNGIARLWKGEEYPGIKLYSRATEILMCASGVAACYYELLALRIENKAKRYRNV